MASLAYGLVLTLTLAALAPAQSDVTGIVTVRDGSAAPSPVADATVLAQTGASNGVIAAATTDSHGRYELESLPEGQVTLRVEAQGYYTLTAGGLESESIARSCPASGECPATDFELARSAVVEGWLTDAVGDPLQGAGLQLMPQTMAGESDTLTRFQNQAGQARSDDRGYFRIWGLRPGRYELSVREGGSPFRGGPSNSETKRQLEIAPGQDSAEVRLRIDDSVETFSLSGRIVGIDEESLQRAAIMIEPLARSEVWRNHMMLRNGAFQTAGVQAGDYLLRLVRFDGPNRETRLLGRITVDRDLEGLELTPLPPTGVRGRVVFVDSPPAMTTIRLETEDNEMPRSEHLPTEPPDYTFEYSALRTGRWRIGVRGDYFALEETTVDLAEGQMAEIEVRVSNQYATVTGVARLGAGPGGDTVREAAAHFTVGLRGPRGRHKAQTDDDGRFFVEEIVPGDYEIAAWSKPDIDVGDDDAWAQARANSKQLTVEPGFEIEIDLTVTPLEVSP